MGQHKDRYNGVYVIMLVLGAGVLFPYNAFISAPDYFSHFYKYAVRSVDENENPEYKNTWDNIESWFVVTYSLPNIVVQLLVAAYGRSVSVRNRILYSIVVITLSMLAIPIVCAIKTTEFAALVVLLIAVGVCGASSAVFQCTIFGLATAFPAHYTQAVMLGSGVAGLSVSLLRVGTKGIGSALAPGDDSTVYFGIAIGWMVLCVVGLLFLQRSAFAQYYVKEFRAIGGEQEELPDPSERGSQASNSTRHSSIIQGSDLDDEFDTGLRATMAIIWRPMVGVYFCLCVSLVVFPGLATKINPQPSSVFSTDWYPVVMVLCFNLGDAIGRMLCRFRKVWVGMDYIHVFVCLRCVFIPYFVIASLNDDLRSDVLSLSAMLAVGATSGWLASLCMMYGATESRLHPSQKETAGNIMSFSLLFGVLTGSFIALPMNVS